MQLIDGGDRRSEVTRQVRSDARPEALGREGSGVLVIWAYSWSLFGSILGHMLGPMMGPCGSLLAFRAILGPILGPIVGPILAHPWAHDGPIGAHSCVYVGTGIGAGTNIDRYTWINERCWAYCCMLYTTRLFRCVLAWRYDLPVLLWRLDGQYARQHARQYAGQYARQYVRQHARQHARQQVALAKKQQHHYSYIYICIYIYIYKRECVCVCVRVCVCVCVWACLGP
jgi:hypothetical protein